MQLQIMSITNRRLDRRERTMDANRRKDLESIVQISNRMLCKAHDNEWTSVAELERERKALVHGYFDQPALRQDAPEVAIAIREILKLNQLITELGEKSRDILGTEMRTNSAGRAAATAYLNHAR